MPLDPENPVVKLCVAGMQAEAENRFDNARAYFEQAWNARQNDLDACIAAHYMARHQATLERILHWNQAALRHADLVSHHEGDAAEIAAYYPSLYLNLGKAHEDLGDTITAHHYYHLAAAKLAHLPQGHSHEYDIVLHRGIAAGLQRTHPA